MDVLQRFMEHMDDVVPIVFVAAGSSILIGITSVGGWLAGQRYRILDSAVELSAGQELSEYMSSLTDEDNMLPYAAVRGRVVPINDGQTIPNSSNMGAVIQTKTAAENYLYAPFWMGGVNPWLNRSDSKQVELNSVPFGLIDVNRNNYSDEAAVPSSSDHDVLLVDNGGTVGDREGLLVKVKTDLFPTEPSFMKLVLGFITGSYTTSMSYEEKILPVNSVITVFGEVSKMSNGQLRIIQSDSALRIKRPFILSLSTAKDVKNLQKAVVMMWGLASGFACGAFAVSIAVGGYMMWRRGRLRRVHGVIVAARNNNENPIQGLNDLQICIVCRGRPREVLLIPCGHVCSCADCCLRLNYKCPVCQAGFSDFHPAYIA